MPAARAAAGRLGIDAAAVPGSGPGGRVLKEDVLRAAAQPVAPSEPSGPVEGERVVPMSPLRRTIARRLVEARQTAALLTTFNEIDMLAVRELRASAGEEFRERHGVGLGFLSIFVQAAVEALRQFPEVGARVEGENIVYPGRYDIGIAVGGGKGLVVPVLRGADRLSLAKIEAAIRDFGERARQGTILPAELEGGVFSISNGGIYGSLFSTPIVNPPQSGILGLHAIQDRPVARDGQVVIRPMMYVALTYDHRIVDGREAVGFLRGIKLRVEDPRRLLLGL
jgi:2-oxoglutarate dehydrogenase E2 component (dihydrolipoamide succinyltransferase)